MLVEELCVQFVNVPMPHSRKASVRQGWHGRGSGKSQMATTDLPAPRTKQTVVEHERHILKQIAKGVKVMPQERISDRNVEQCDEQFVSQSGEIRVAEQVVAVPVPLFLI